MRLSHAFRVFFRVLRDDAFADQVARLELPASTKPTPAAPAPPPAPPSRNDALTLLAILQREGRLVDFLQEPITPYNDAQIGSAVREVHRGCRQVLERLFDLAPAIATTEGATLRVEAGYDPGRIRLTGPAVGTPPCSGTVAHPGWEARRCELPEWTGTAATARVIAPAEVEIR
ncbi:MAG TPA: DUF2760 domain-containing protein [Verrucomicrobiota bacterium]|nr:DUF2760 domain-containing protein [Verrucomicrobiota bacterium]